MFWAAMSHINRDKEQFSAKAQRCMSELLVLHRFLHS